MQGASGRIVVNPTFQDCVYEDEKPTMLKPMKRQMTYHVQKEIGHDKSADDPWKQPESQGSHDYGKIAATHGSNRALWSLVAFFCLVSIAALLLTLFMFFGKIGYKCGCTEDQLG